MRNVHTCLWHTALTIHPLLFAIKRSAKEYHRTVEPSSQILQKYYLNKSYMSSQDLSQYYSVPFTVLLY